MQLLLILEVSHVDYVGAIGKVITVELGVLYLITFLNSVSKKDKPSS